MRPSTTRATLVDAVIVQRIDVDGGEVLELASKELVAQRSRLAADLVTKFSASIRFLGYVNSSRADQAKNILFSNAGQTVRSTMSKTLFKTKLAFVGLP